MSDNEFFNFVGGALVSSLISRYPRLRPTRGRAHGRYGLQTLPHRKQAAYGYSFAVHGVAPKQIIEQAGKPKG